MFFALGIDAEGDDQAVLAEDLAVDEHHADVERIERAREERVHLLGGQRDEPPRHRATRGRVLVHGRRQRVKRASILARRHSGGDRLHRVPVERVARRRPGEARQRYLALGRAHAQARDLDLATAEGHAARRAAGPPGPAVGVVTALGPAQRFTVSFHHRHQGLATGVDAQLVECLTRVEQGAEHGQRQLEHVGVTVGALAFGRTTAMLFHGGAPSVWLAPLSYHRTGEGVATPFSLVQQNLGHPLHPRSRIIARRSAPASTRGCWIVSSDTGARARRDRRVLSSTRTPRLSV